MRKEVIFAIVIGFTLGLVITFGIWTANKAIKQAQIEVAPSELKKAEETPTPTPTLRTLMITSPENNDLLSSEEVEITGKTVPGAFVVVIYPEGEQIAEADGEGEFSVKITLVGGANEVSLTAVDKEGNEETKTLNLAYSTAEI